MTPRTCVRCRRAVLRVTTTSGISKVVDAEPSDAPDAGITDVGRTRVRWVPPGERAGVEGRHREHWRTCGGSG